MTMEIDHVLTGKINKCKEENFIIAYFNPLLQISVSFSAVSTALYCTILEINKFQLF